MDVFGEVLHDGVCLVGGLHVALDVVGRVEDRSVVGGVDRLDEVLHTAGDVAVDVLLVLVQEHDASFFGEFDHGLRATHDFVAVLVRVLALRDEEAEHADVLRAEELGNFDAVARALKVVLERVGDLDLSKVRSDGGQRDASGVELLLGEVQLLFAHVEHLRGPSTAKLHVLDSELLQQHDLVIELKSDFVCESCDRPHRR